MDAAAKHEGIVVIGTPRSGTTLLRRLLDSHPDIACPGETSVLSACARFLHAERIAEGVEIGVVAGLGFAGFPAEEVLRRLRELAFSFHVEHARRQGKTRWAEKTAFDAFHLEAIERLCGDHAHFICVQRHGLDVACSIEELCRKNGGYLGELHEYVKRHPRPLDAFAHAWVDLTGAIRDFAGRHPGNAVTVRYEDLVADPEAHLRRLLGSVGADWDPGLLDRALASREGAGLGDWKTYGRKQIDASSIGRWQALSPYEASRLGEICNPMLTACGYDPIPVGDRRSLAEAQRRYELGLMVNAMRPEGERDGQPGS